MWTWSGKIDAVGSGSGRRSRGGQHHPDLEQGLRRVGRGPRRRGDRHGDLRSPPPSQPRAEHPRRELPAAGKETGWAHRPPSRAPRTTLPTTTRRGWVNSKLAKVGQKYAGVDSGAYSSADLARDTSRPEVLSRSAVTGSASTTGPHIPGSRYGDGRRRRLGPRPSPPTTSPTTSRPSARSSGGCAARWAASRTTSASSSRRGRRSRGDVDFVERDAAPASE